MGASYEASYLIAKSIKPFLVGENLVSPATVKMSGIVHEKSMVTIFAKYPYAMTLLPEELLKLLTTNLSSQSFTLRKVQSLQFSSTKRQMYQKCAAATLSAVST